VLLIYFYKKEYIKLIDFLEETKVDDKVLLETYIRIKNYDRAYKLALEIYQQSGDIEYLGQSAIYEYESKKNNLNESVIKSVTEKFERVISTKDSALYFNYFGYLLIDHEIDVKKGIDYVKKALQLSPESSYYLDSLAWGYYKLSKCKKAKEIMQKVIKLEGSDQEEIRLHINEIEKCLKKRKGK
jgi:uncharacterized protein HemY